MVTLVNYQYDADNLLIKAGDLNLTRNARKMVYSPQRN
jgi:hypothetical protein